MRQPPALANARDRVDVVDSAQFRNRLAKGFGLGFPVRGVEARAVCYSGRGIEAVDYALCGLCVAVGDEDFDAV